MIDDLPARYQEYLARFAETLGEVKPGAFVKYNGRLIKKLTLEELAPALVEFDAISNRYRESVERGDTINDVVLKLLREAAANLVLASPE